MDIFIFAHCISTWHPQRQKNLIPHIEGGLFSLRKKTETYFIKLIFLSYTENLISGNSERPSKVGSINVSCGNEQLFKL